MPYNDDDRLNDLDQSSLYDDQDLYEPDTFRERLDDSSLTDEEMADDPLMDDEMADDAPQTDAMTSSGTGANTIEDDFGETISADTNPHIDEQLGDDKLNQEAESDYPAPSTDETQHESMIDRVKDKIDEMTGHDKP